MARPWGDSLGYRSLRGLLGRALRARALDVEGLPANLANAPVYVLEERSNLARLALESVCLRRGLPLAQGELAGPSTAPGLRFCAAGKATGCSGGAAPGAFPKPCPRSRSSLAAMPLHKSSPFPSSGVEPLNARARSSPGYSASAGPPRGGSGAGSPLRSTGIIYFCALPRPSNGTLPPGLPLGHRRAAPPPTAAAALSGSPRGSLGPEPFSPPHS